MKKKPPLTIEQFDEVIQDTQENLNNRIASLHAEHLKIAQKLWARLSPEDQKAVTERETALMRERMRPPIFARETGGLVDVKGNKLGNA